MKPPCCSRSVLWYLLLLGAVTLPLLLYWDGLNSIQQLATGICSVMLLSSEPVRDKNKNSKRTHFDPSQDEVLDSNPPGHNPLNLRASSEDVPSSLGEEQQQQVKIQDFRHRLLAKVCSKYLPDLLGQVPSKRQLNRIFVEDRSKLLYCEVPKTGCSNWKRVLMVLGGKATSVLSITHEEAHFLKKLPILQDYNLEDITERLHSYLKVLFVREPFERLVSVFRDKLKNPDEKFHSTHGREIISRYRTNPSERALKTGDGVTFREFVQYLLDPRRWRSDSHWEPVSKLCQPCLLHFDIIGKFEKMTSEANLLLRSIGAPPNVWYPDYKDRNPQDERTSSSIMKKYFSQLNATERQGVYDFYHLDYLLFNYSKPFPDLL